MYLSILYLAVKNIYLLIKFAPTYELIPEPVPLLEQRGGDDQTVDKGKQDRPEHNWDYSVVLHGKFYSVMDILRDCPARLDQPESGTIR